MGNIKYSVPYNGNSEELEEIFRLNREHDNNIREVYFSGPSEYSGSGRVVDEVDIGQLSETMTRIHDEGIRCNLIMNSTCDGADWYSSENYRGILNYLKKLHFEFGLEVVTIANPLIIKKVREILPDIEICASVLSDIDSVSKAAFFKDIGVNVITPDANINRNINLLTEIKNIAGVELKIMVNEGCLYRCPFRKFHFNYMSHVSKEKRVEESHFLYPCHDIVKNDLSQILKSEWIRPEDIGKYSKVTDYFKIVGRALPNSKVIRAIKAYMDESWDGDILDIISSSLGSFALKYATYLDNKTLDKYGFFEKVTSCSHNCNRCSYCEFLAGRLIGGGEFTSEKMVDKGLKAIMDDLQEKGIM
jgi:collagenase-like PrtC family protease